MRWPFRRRAHRYEVAGVELRMMQRYQDPVYIRNWDGTAVPFGAPEPVTLVLYRCACGQVKQQQLDGHWTLEQVRGV